MNNTETITIRTIDEPLVSIVLPVYNVAKYLHQSLDTVINQTYRNLEIICVDDGSTDDSLEILKDYKKIDDRVRILAQDNQGVGLARNAGMDLATGKYIIFWDPDDYFDLNAIKTLVEKAETEDSDVCCCNAQTFDSETGDLLYHPYLIPPFPKKSPFSWRDCPNWIFFIASSVSWNKLVKLSLLQDNNIRFPSCQSLEDSLYMFLVLCYAERICICEKRLINYRANRPNGLAQIADSNSSNSVATYSAFYDELNKRKLLEDTTLRECFFRKAASMYHYQIRYFPSFTEFENIYALYSTPESATSDCPPGKSARIDNMRELSAGDYLLDSFKDLLQIEKEVKQKLLESTERKAQLERECASLNDINQALNEQIRELKVKESEQQKKLQNAEAKLRRIKSSRSYKLGKTMTFLPRKLKKSLAKKKTV